MMKKDEKIITLTLKELKELYREHLHVYLNGKDFFVPNERKQMKKRLDDLLQRIYRAEGRL